MPLFGLLRLFLTAVLFGILLLRPSESAAEGITPVRSTAVLTATGQLDVSSRFRTDLPDPLKQALTQGVPLHFTLSYQLSAPTMAAYKFKLGQLVGSDSSVSYKLSFHPLTNRYRVTVGTFSTEYASLDTALRGIGAIAGWRVLPAGTLADTDLAEIHAEIRLSLSTSQLPKPFQINAITAKNWQLDSGWKPLSVSRS
ncbi:DUF4390 domain-containing protein [Kingella potus]|uniref:DUF4390 domain-containing protein n=1 Tax=Kingella potus TaxID=265175 RepID=UPI003CCC71E7